MSTIAHRRELLTVKELAAEWRQHPATVYRKIHDGTIPAVRLGDGTSALRIPRSWLEALLSATDAACVSPASSAERRARPVHHQHSRRGLLRGEGNGQ